MNNRSSQTQSINHYLRVRIVALAIAITSSAALISAFWLRSAKQAQVSPLSYWRYPTSKIGTANLESVDPSCTGEVYCDGEISRLIGVTFQPQTQQLLAYVEEENSVVQDTSQPTETISGRLSLVSVGFPLSLNGRSQIQKITFVKTEAESNLYDTFAVSGLNNRLVTIGSGKTAVDARVWQYAPISTSQGSIYEQKLLGTIDIASQTGGPSPVAISADGKLFATTDTGGKMLIGEVRSNSQSRQQTSEASAEDIRFRHIITLERSALDIAFSPDGKIVAAPLLDGTLHLWNTQSGEEIVVFDAPNDPLAPHHTDITFSSDGRLLALRNATATYLWSTATGKLLHTFPTGNTEIINYPAVVAISSKGEWLASSSGRDGKITFWDIQSGKLLRVLKSPLSSHGYIVFNSDDTQLAAGALRQPTVVLWKLPEKLR